MSTFNTETFLHTLGAFVDARTNMRVGGHSSGIGAVEKRLRAQLQALEHAVAVVEAFEKKQAALRAELLDAAVGIDEEMSYEMPNMGIRPSPEAALAHVASALRDLAEALSDEAPLEHVEPKENS